MAPVKIKLSENDRLQQKEIRFFNLHRLRYQPGTSITDFYYLFRNLILSVLRKKGDIVIWQNNEILAEDEQLSPTFEEIIFINVLDLVDKRLLGRFGDHYQLLSGKSKWLMDNMNDIFVNTPTFLKEMERSAYAKCETDGVKYER